MKEKVYLGNVLEGNVLEGTFMFSSNIEGAYKLTSSAFRL